MSEPATTIAPNVSTAEGQLVVAVRQLLLGLGPVAAWFGFSHLGTLFGLLAAIAGPTATVIVVVMGQFHERHHQQIKAANVVLSAALADVSTSSKGSQ